jgi:hypothetical protein
VVVLLALSGKEPDWTFKSLAAEVGLSPAEVHAALKRSARSTLYDPVRRKVRGHALMEFLTHGMRYVFPATRLPRAHGIPTAHCAEPLSGRFALEVDDRVVWPHPQGTEFGDAIEPLFRSVPEVALRNSKLYRRLALVDALRMGGARERQLAAEALDRELRT